MKVDILEHPRPVEVKEMATRSVFHLRGHWYMLISKTHKRDDTHVAFGLETGDVVYIEPTDQVTPARNARVEIEQ